MKTKYIFYIGCEDFKMHTAHYNELLKLYVTNESDFSPGKLLMEMKGREIYPNSLTYEMCITYLCTKGNVKEALTLVEDMTKFRLPLTETIFNSLMLGYSRSG